MRTPPYVSSRVADFGEVTFAAPWGRGTRIVTFMILGYEVRRRTLIIKRPGWSTRIPLDGLRAATPNPAALRYSIRIFGNGGLFAFNGLFGNKTLGRYRAYVTDSIGLSFLIWLIAPS